jgi:hypothetical protein
MDRGESIFSRTQYTMSRKSARVAPDILPRTGSRRRCLSLGPPASSRLKPREGGGALSREAGEGSSHSARYSPSSGVSAKRFGGAREVSSVRREFAGVAERFRRSAKRFRESPKGFGDPPRGFGRRQKSSASRRELSGRAERFRQSAERSRQVAESPREAAKGFGGPPRVFGQPPRSLGNSFSEPA